jgi:AraC family transcriptional regulator of arabinose operon
MDARIARILTLIEAAPGMLSPVDDLARGVNLSPSRLRHLFREEVSISLGAYVRAQRLRLAEHLLRSTFLSVKEIGNTVGFGNEAHFVRTFHRTYALPPERFRRAATEGNR